jgi:threonine dehydrogenase-like Zn-dependent dehydrogenase
MSRVVRFHEQGGPEVLKIEEREVGAPGPGELRVRVQAIGLNRSEAMFRRGGYLAPRSYPSLIGYEAAGIVEAAGEGVAGFSTGQRVSVIPSFPLGDYGVYAEQAIVPARSVIPAPPGLSPVEAASVWMQYFTAYAIIEWGRATLGDYVILPAASSSVGLAAIQLANWAGATPIATTRRAAKADVLKQHGARHVIATEESDLAAEVMRITAGKGARIVFDPVGGPYLRRPQRPADDASALELRVQGHRRAQLDRLEHLEPPGALRARSGRDPARARGRPAHARHRANLPARGDRRGAPVSRVQPAGRQDRGDRGRGLRILAAACANAPVATPAPRAPG